MSWNNSDEQRIPLDVENTPKKEPSYVQVPSSSPIYVKSSPSKDGNTLAPPTREINNHNSGPIDKAKELALEKKRQAIRQHKDFKVVQKRFFYLEESDIFKGFVKGRGNLRDITQWLSDNYNKDEILGKLEAERRKEEEESERIKAEETRLKLEREYENQKRLQLEKEISERERREQPKVELDEEDNSPIKVRAKSKANVIQSPVKQPIIEHESPEKKSTKVEIHKPKQSILDKYKYKSKVQPRIDHVLLPQVDTQVKRRKLVRASTVSSESSPTPLTPQSLTSAFGYQEPQSLPKLKLTIQQGATVLRQENENYNNNNKGNMIVDDDDLERLEEKIRENKRKGKTMQRKIHVSDDDLDDDDISDDMSEEDDAENYKTGLTSIDAQILEFLNNAPVQDIVEISNIPPKVAELLVSRRPFLDIYQIAEDKLELPSAEEQDNKAPKKRRGGQRKNLGLKVVENTEFSLKGYRAVDSLIKKCSEYGDLIANQMKNWGVTVTGDGELEMTDLEPTNEVIDLDENKEKDEENEDEDEDVVVVSNKHKGLRYIKSKPSLLAEDIELKGYQQVGINWLNLLYHNNLSCILADEMGLGKTCQVISFMAHLKETEASRGPNLVIVPSSTIENWLREFNKFCPDLVVQAYYGSQLEREELRYELDDKEYDVLVTTYNLATGANLDFKFLRNQGFNMIVYDEGHMLKNSTSERYTKLMRLNAKFRLLLTGTPLQNNLKELVSLLAFMLPDLFNAKRDDLQGLFNQKVSTINDKNDERYNPLLSNQAIAKAKTMMTPFVLRRKKNQVLKHLPSKSHQIIECDLTPLQKQIYSDYLEQGKKTRLERERRKNLVGKEAEAARKNPMPSSSNVLMSLRKASLHPLLFRTVYADDKIEKMAKAIMNEPEYVEANREYIVEDMKVMSDFELNNLCEKFPKTLSKFTLKEKEFLNSGKVKSLIKLLKDIIVKKEKILVFSLFTQMLDILEKILSISGISFLRLDGQTSVDTRQDLIDKFYEDDKIPVFLLSTKAGGFGINLVAANNVIIFDQSFNPHDDKQAEDRAHRVGQTNEVTVYKLITRNTIEENMLQLAENKLQLDQSISSDGNEAKLEEKTASLFEKLLFEGN